MKTVEKQISVIDERLYSEEFRKKLLDSPVLKEKQGKGQKLANKLLKDALRK